MDPGQFNRRFTLQQRTGSRDSYGQLPNTWATIGGLWGKLTSAGGNERIHDKQVRTELVQVIHTHYRTEFADPSAASVYRLTLVSAQGTRIFNLQAVGIDDMRQFVELSCNEGLNDGI